MALPATTDRVVRHTPDVSEGRLAELDREWEGWCETGTAARHDALRDRLAPRDGVRGRTRSASRGIR